MATKKDDEKAQADDARDGTGGPDPKDNPITPDDASDH